MRLPWSVAGKPGAPSADESPARVPRFRGHFRFNTVSVLCVLAFLVLGISLQGFLSVRPNYLATALIVAEAFAGAAILYLLPFWPMTIAVVAGIWAAPLVLWGADVNIVSLALTLGFLVAPGFEVINQWDKIVVLRLGRFRRVRGPGVVFLVPLVDTIAGFVDTRIRVTDFSAEKSLTLDTVPVHVDALAFWMIWDAGKAVLEVEDYRQAVILSAQTALRSSIGSNTLTALLSERERLGEEIQRIVDAKTNPWGITIISVEFKEILVPKKLEDALSRVAQAERERTARVILGATEAEVAASFREAAGQYRDDPTALQLRAMNMIYESIRNKGGLVLAPASALETMNLGTVLGTTAYGKNAGILPGDGPGPNAGAPAPDARDKGPEGDKE